jgi:hypothetical protein
VITNGDVLELFDHWNTALQTKAPNYVVGLSSMDVLVVPTMSNHVRRFGEVAINSGRYTFSLGNGASLPARITYVDARQGHT